MMFCEPVQACYEQTLTQARQKNKLYIILEKSFNFNYTRLFSTAMKTFSALCFWQEAKAKNMVSHSFFFPLFF